MVICLERDADLHVCVRACVRARARARARARVRVRVRVCDTSSVNSSVMLLTLH